MEYFLFLLGGLGAINFLIFSLLSHFYKYRLHLNQEEENKNNLEMEVEEEEDVT